MTFIKKLILASLVIIVTSCSSFHKYATLRLYEVYESHGISACQYKEDFNDCIEKTVFDLKISDNNQYIALAIFINDSNTVDYYGFNREEFPRETMPIREFLSWVDSNKEDKKIAITKKRGGSSTYLFKNSEETYIFRYVTTRRDEKLLVISNAISHSAIGMNKDEVKNMLYDFDSWYSNTFSSEKISK